MAEHKVLITTSGLGSRLGNLTKFTNKSLVRVGDKPAISHIIDQYSKDIEIVVTLGHYGDHVKQFLTLCYPDRKFEFVEIDHFTGPSSSLLYSISCCEKNLQQPFIFHACDTILGPKYFDHTKKVSSNWVIGCPSDSSHHYRTFNVRNNHVVRINEKGEQNFDFAHVGVVGIHDYKAFWGFVKEQLTTPSTDLSDCHVINDMLETNHKFSCFQLDSWLDIGNVDSLKAAKASLPSSFNVLDKDDENIFIFDGFVYKFFHDTKICQNRVARFEFLTGLTPKLAGYTNNFYKYEYAKGELLAEVVDIPKFQTLLNWSEKNLWKPIPSVSHKANCLAFYKDKTNDRIKRFLAKYNLEDTAESINGVAVPKISEMLSQIDFDSLSSPISTGFHGDFILDNILVDGDNMTLIDWRQDFNGDIKHGDMFYDLAKLNHNLVVNHSMIKHDQYHVVFDENQNVKCDINVKKSLIDCKTVLENFCKVRNIDYKKIDMLTSLIWINMSPLHEHPLDLFLYYFGKYNLFLRLNT